MLGLGRRLSVIFVNHSGFHSNSAHHIAGFAHGLHALGHRVRVVADGGAADSGLPPGVPIDRDKALLPGSAVEALMADPETIVHAWTPRECVRRTVESLTGGRLRYIVHLEDHEEEIASAFLNRPWDELCRMSEGVLDRLIPENLSHPIRYRRFLGGAAGVSIIVDTLRDLIPPDRPAMLLEPGVDARLFRPSLSLDERSEMRRHLGVGSATTLVFHPGAMHAANSADVLGLYAAIHRLRAEGCDLVFLRTGEGVPDPASHHPDDVRYLGFVPRERLIALLDLADICVQPGGPTRFNRYRFPSKLPEFFAMGRATITAAANVGRRLVDGRHAVLLRTGDINELTSAITLLHGDARLRRHLGRHARKFACHALRWPDKVRALERFYLRLAPPGEYGRQSPARMNLP